MCPTYHYNLKHDASLSASHAWIVPIFPGLFCPWETSQVLIPSRLELEQPPTTHLYNILPSTSRNNRNFDKYATHVPMDALFQHGRGARVCVYVQRVMSLACFKLQTNFCRISQFWKGIHVSRTAHGIGLKQIYQTISYFIKWTNKKNL